MESAVPAIRRLLRAESLESRAVPTVTSLSGREGGASSAVATVLQVIRDDWGTGQTDDIIVRNTGTSPMRGWTVEFDAEFTVTGLWDARLLSHSGSHYVFRNIPNSPKAVIQPHTQITFGFNTGLDPNADGKAIRDIKLNGQALTGSGNPTPPVISPGAHGSITQSIPSFWGTGDTTNLTIKDTGAMPMSGWIVTFTSDFEITQIWNAQLIGHSGNQYTVKNIPNFWNAVIQPGTAITFGFNTRMGSEDSTDLRNVTLNGSTVPGFGTGNPSPPPQLTPGTVTQTVRSSWGTGATSDITIQNIGTTKLTGWTVEFDAPYMITDFWNAQLVSHAGTHYVFKNIPNFWNAIIQPKGTATFGFNAAFDLGTDPSIQNIKLNGVLVSTGGGSNPGGSQNLSETVTQAIRAQWTDGSTNDITIQNTGTTAIDGWTVTFDAPFQITDVWNAQIVSHVGTTYTIRSIPGSWNALIAGGTFINFGFNTLLNPGDGLTIGNIMLNGKAV
jgi:chitinase